MEDADFLRDLFHRFKFAQPGSDAQVEIVEFLQELSNLSKCLQLAQKRILFQRLVQLGLFEVLYPPSPTTTTKHPLNTHIQAHMFSPTSRKTSFGSMVLCVHLHKNTYQQRVFRENQFVKMAKILSQASSFFQRRS